MSRERVFRKMRNETTSKSRWKYLSKAIHYLSTSKEALPSHLNHPSKYQSESYLLNLRATAHLSLTQIMAPSKRRLVSSSQSTQSSQQSTTTRGPPKKRARHSPPHPTSLPLQTLPSTEPRASTSTSKPLEKEDVKHPLPEAKKRTLHPGSLRRLTTSRPSTSTTSSTTTTDNRARTRDNQTLSGNKIGGKSKDLKDGSKVEEIWVRNSIKKKGKGGEGGVGGGMGFSAWLKKGVGAFVERG